MYAYAYRAPHCGALSFMPPLLAASTFPDCSAHNWRVSSNVGGIQGRYEGLHRRAGRQGRSGPRAYLLLMSPRNLCLVGRYILLLDKTLRVTPAMAANVKDRLWSIEELVERTTS